MARLRKYVNRDDFYINASFRKENRIHNVTYQISPSGLDTLLSEGLIDGDRIGEHVFHFLIATGQIYTGKSGSKGHLDNVAEVSPCKDLTQEEVDRSFDPLSIPSSIQKASDIRKYIKSNYPKLKGSLIRYWVNTIISERNSGTQVSDNKILETILHDRVITEIQDNGTHIVISCKKKKG